MKKIENNLPIEVLYKKLYELFKSKRPLKYVPIFILWVFGMCFVIFLLINYIVGVFNINNLITSLNKYANLLLFIPIVLILIGINLYEKQMKKEINSQSKNIKIKKINTYEYFYYVFSDFDTLELELCSQYCELELAKFRNKRINLNYISFFLLPMIIALIFAYIQNPQQNIDLSFFITSLLWGYLLFSLYNICEIIVNRKFYQISYFKLHLDYVVLNKKVPNSIYKDHK